MLSLCKRATPGQRACYAYSATILERLAVLGRDSACQEAHSRVVCIVDVTWSASQVDQCQAPRPHAHGPSTSTTAVAFTPCVSESYQPVAPLRGNEASLHYRTQASRTTYSRPFSTDAGEPGPKKNWRDWISKKLSETETQEVRTIQSDNTAAKMLPPEIAQTEALLRKEYEKSSARFSSEGFSSERETREASALSDHDELDKLLGFDDLDNEDEADFLRLDSLDEEGDEAAEDEFAVSAPFSSANKVLSDAAMEALKVYDLDDPDPKNQFRFRKDRLYYPGQTYDPEELNISVPSPQTNEFERPARTWSKADVLRRADFRNVRFLAQFLTETARIQHRVQTKLPAKAQRRVSREIRRARALGLMPYTLVGKPAFRFYRLEDVSPEEDDDVEVEEQAII